METAQAIEEIKLSAEITSALRSMAKENGLTLATIMQGAWAILLSRYSGEADVVFGVVRSNRRGTIEGADDVIGLCINTLPMRVNVNSEIMLLSWLKDVRAQWITMRDHAAYPFGESPGLERSAGRSPAICQYYEFSKLPIRYQVANAGWCVVQPPSSYHRTDELPCQPVSR